VLSVALVGSGYWGNVLADILRKKGILFTHFTSRLEQADAYPCLSHISKLFELYNRGGFYSKLILASGPSASQTILKQISNSPLFTETSIWLEKPVYINESMLTSIGSFKFQSSRFFVDYPYTAATLKPRHRNLHKLGLIGMRSQIISINIFSRRAYSRAHSFVYDFLPHHLTILSCVFGVTTGSICQILNRNNTQNIEARLVDGGLFRVDIRISSDLIIRLSFGVSSQKSFISFYSHGNIVVSTVDELFSDRPVDDNLETFLSAERFDKLPCQDWQLHSDIYQVSSFIYGASM